MMAKGRQYGAVVLRSCRAVAGGADYDQRAGTVPPSVAQAAERNVLLSRADLEVCASSQHGAGSEPA
jgi:hypothetical protein